MPPTCCTALSPQVPPFYLLRYTFPTVTILYWRRCPDGKLRIEHQIDHHSLFVMFWVLGWPFTAVAERIWRPATGWLWQIMGWGVDLASGALQGVGEALTTVRRALEDRQVPAPPFGGGVERKA